MDSEGCRACTSMASRHGEQFRLRGVPGPVAQLPSYRITMVPLH